MYASGIGNVAVLLHLDRLNAEDSDQQVVWRGKAKTALYSCNSTPFLEDGMIFGADCMSGALVGARISDGKRNWQTFEPTTEVLKRAQHAFRVEIRKSCQLVEVAVGRHI